MCIYVFLSISHLKKIVQSCFVNSGGNEVGLFMEGNDMNRNNSEYDTAYNINQERSVVVVGDGRRKGEMLLFSSSFCHLNMSLYLKYL